jgi:hypothetical protein
MGASVASTVSDTKPCKVCAEAIKAAARKCIHCDSYQDWHSNINVSSTVLSLLVALISVLTTALPVIKETITTKNSDLSFSFQGSVGNLVSVLVTNQGARPGTVANRGKIAVTIKEEGSTRYFDIDITSLKNSAAVTIDPDKSVLLNYSQVTADAAMQPKLVAGQTPSACILMISNTDFRAVASTANLAVSCETIKPVISELM